MIQGFGQAGGMNFQRWVEGTSLEDCKWLVREYWKRIVIFAIFGFGVAAAYSKWNPEVYVSQATVRFIPPQVAQQFVTPNVAMQVDQRIFAVTQLVKSRLTATKMIESLNLYPTRRRFLPIADVVPVFQKDLNLRTMTGGGDRKESVPSIVISYQYADPELAQKVVQRIVELIYEENRRYRSDQSIGTTEFLQQEVKTVIDQIRQIEVQLSVLPTPGGEDKEYRNIFKASHLHDLQRRLTDLKHVANYTQQDRDQRKALVEGLEQQIRAQIERSEGGAAAISPATEHLRNVVSGLESRVEELRLRYKPDHMDRMLAENALNRARQELAKQLEVDRSLDRDRSTEQMRLQLARSRSELTGYESTLARHRAEESALLKEIEDLNKEFTPNESREAERLTLIREYQNVKDHYTDLLKKQKGSELASDMERRGHGETVELVEPPTLPLNAEMPTRVVVLSAGVFGGAAFGYLLGLLSFFRKPVVRIPGHIDVLGDYPVLVCLPGNIPILAMDSAGRALWGMRMAFVAVVLLGAILTGCGTAISGKQGLLKKAEEASARGDNRTAIIHLRKALKEDPRFGEAHYQLANVFLHVGQILPARESLVRAAELLEDRFDVLEKLGDVTYQVYFSDPGRPATLLRELEETANKIARKWPEKPSGYRLKAQVLLERRRPQEAIDLMEQTLEKIEDGPIRTQLASAYYGADDPEQAEKHLRLCIERLPKFSPGYDLLYLQLMERGEVEEARKVLAEKAERHGGIEASLQLAAHEDATGNRAGAEERLVSVSQKFKDDNTAYARIGDFWLHRGDHEKARYWYSAGRSAYPVNRGFYTGRLAELLLAKQDTAAAQALIAKELESNPKDPLMKAYEAAFALDGDSLAQRKQAQARLESVLAVMPNSPFVRLHLGRAYLLTGDYGRASEQLQQCVNLDPNYAPGWLALAESDMASGSMSAAEERLGALLKRAPGYTPARLLQAQATLAQRRPAEAKKAIESLLEVEPENAEAMIILARAKAGLGQRMEATNLLEKAHALRPNDPRPVLLLARLDLDSGGKKAALDRLKKEAEVIRDSPELASMLASVALMAGEDKLALDQYKRLVDRYGDNLEFRLGYAGSLGISGRRKEAEEQYKVVQQKAGNDPRPWLLYGALAASSGNATEARQAYQEALKRDRQNPFVLNNLAFLLARNTEDLQTALSMAEEAKRGLPASLEVSDTLAYVYVRLGMKRNAVAVLEQMLPHQQESVQERTRTAIEKINRGELAEVRRDMEQASGTMD